MIDHIIANENAAKKFLDVRAYRGVEIGTDHYYVQGVIRLETTRRPARKIAKRINTRALDDPTNRWLYQRRMNVISAEVPKSEDIETEWVNLKHIVTTAAKESLGMLPCKIGPKRIKNWDDEIQDLVRKKRLAFRKFMGSKKEADRLEYQELSARVKRKSRRLQRDSWDNFVTFLEHDTYKLRPKVYRIIRRIDTNFNEGVRLPKIKLEEAKEYFQELWSHQSTQETVIEEQSERNTEEEITFTELQEALKAAKNAKAPGEDGIPTELYKYASGEFKRRLLDFMNRLYREEKVPDEFKMAIVIPLFKKGDMSNLKNYRGISLLNTCYKIYAKILAKRLAEYAEGKLSESQNGFRKGRSCTDASYTVKLLMEKRVEHNLETHICFIDLEKAYDRVNRNKLFEVLNDLGVSGKIRRVIQSIYNNTKIQIRIGSKLSEHAEINRGVRQGCPLSCVLFNMYMDHMVKEWQKKDPKGIQMDQQQEISTVLFADDQAVLAETEDDLQRAMYQLAKTSEAYDMKISSGKTKTMAFKGKDAIRSKIVIDGKIIEQVNTFRYLGNEMSYQGEVDVGGKIAKFLRVTGLINRTLRNNKVQKETRLKVYNTLAVPMITYGCEVWALKKTDKRRITAAEMKFMRRTAGVTLRDRIKSETITSNLGVTPIMKKIKSYRKKWRNHVERMEETRSPKQVLQYTPVGRRSRGRPRKRIVDTSSSSSASSTPQQTGHLA
ncbi:MAG TPA: reverse transcriptase family protein [Gemmatimonadales bacterium]|nr:reverse transcriptase family protein [Gemmatimonadales bacterium]